MFDIDPGCLVEISRPKIRGLIVKTNEQRNRAATLRVEFSFRRIRRSGSHNCTPALLSQRVGETITKSREPIIIHDRIAIGQLMN